ncbi:hypothetical protein BD289DRAFT_367485 [Coniella lustricola]|uniref:DUF3752 domain-containing protein n=1 Tax=Coniella lustricola TaxID=2025994 RepID=A0A2T3A9G7_9PEZI|nr:hypothetical protein BD289DRAFT_367485 [Coniella lustricola]
MSSIGPQLPPHLAKRKRSSDSDSDHDPDSPPSKISRPSRGAQNAQNSDSDDDAYGPSIPSTTTATSPPTAPSKPSIGPAMHPPPPTNTNEIALDDSDSDFDTGSTSAPTPAPAQSTTSDAPKRVFGPAAPPAPLLERPASPPSASDSASDEDDYGPSLPSASKPSSANNPSTRQSLSSTTTAPAAPKRDDWMLAPPSASDGYRERDPTKIRSRKFASGASATTRPKDGSNSEISSIWTETPEEKVKRLADAVLGRGSAANGLGASHAPSSSKSGGRVTNDKTDSDRDGKIKAFTEQTRGKSLYEEHQAARKAGLIDKNVGGAKKGGPASGGDDEDDDPSKRAFDREKDMGLGGKITASQRKQLLNRAADFGGRFSKGNFL